MIKVLIVDDDKLARRGLVSLMDWEAYGMVVSEVCKKNDIPYYYGPGTLTYVGCVLVE